MTNPTHSQGRRLYLQSWTESLRRREIPPCKPSHPTSMCLSRKLIFNSISLPLNPHIQSPLYLLLFSLFPFTTSSSPILSSALFTIVDYLAADVLRRIWTARKWEEEARLKKRSDMDRKGRGRRWLREDWEEGVMLLSVPSPLVSQSHGVCDEQD